MPTCRESRSPRPRLPPVRRGAMARSAHRGPDPARAGATTRAGARSRALACLGCLVGIEPPQRWQPGSRIFWQGLGMAEAIPAGVAQEAIGKLRHDEEIPQQHAIERLGGSDETLTVLRK